MRRDVTLLHLKERLELNVLKSHLRITLRTLLEKGTSQLEIERVTGIDRKTIRRYAREAKSPGVATGFGDEIIRSPHPGHRLRRLRRARRTELGSSHRCSSGATP